MIKVWIGCEICQKLHTNLISFIVNNVTYSLVDLETGEIYKDENGNDLTGKRKVLEDYLANNYEFQNKYLTMLHKFISASDNTYGNILDAREQAEISNEESAVEKGNKQKDVTDNDSEEN